MRAVPRRGARADHVARPEFDEPRQILDLPGDVENHVPGRPVLQRLAVHARGDAQLCQVLA